MLLTLRPTRSGAAAMLRPPTACAQIAAKRATSAFFNRSAAHRLPPLSPSRPSRVAFLPVPLCMALLGSLWHRAQLQEDRLQEPRCLHPPVVLRLPSHSSLSRAPRAAMGSLRPPFLTTLLLPKTETHDDDDHARRTMRNGFHPPTCTENPILGGALPPPLRLRNSCTNTHHRILQTTRRSSEPEPHAETVPNHRSRVNRQAVQ